MFIRQGNSREKGARFGTRHFPQWNHAHRRCLQAASETELGRNPHTERTRLFVFVLLCF